MLLHCKSRVLICVQLISSRMLSALGCRPVQLVGSGMLSNLVELYSSSRRSAHSRCLQLSFILRAASCLTHASTGLQLRFILCVAGQLTHARLLSSFILREAGQLTHALCTGLQLSFILRAGSWLMHASTVCFL